MLSKLFGKRSRQAAVLPRVDAGSRVYAVGDIHGRADLLRALRQMIHEDAYAAQAPRNVVVYLGDYVDRGDASRAVIDCLLDERLPGFEEVHLLGNHEDSMLRFLTDLEIGPAWLAYGGAATLCSYGVAPPTSERELARAQDELHRKLPQRHLDFLRRLKLSHCEGDYFFVHAGARPGVSLAAQAPEDMLWIRDEFLRSDAEFGKVVVHGHTITDLPEVKRNRIGIDTGAFASGTLTCLALWDADWKFLQT
ncbi:MAG TPA: metallophosphoesterase family protein [Stellaceae bacterium]|nr:metallophosphoesterase family protein [Stellaceae bacterium]